MRRLIDADELKKLRHEVIQGRIKFDGNEYDLIDKCPTVDAVPVVRCLECKHHYWEQEPCHGKSVHYCKLPHMWGVEVFKEFFCYYGERKEGTNHV